MDRAGLRVLITNNALANRAGSELYVRDIALELLARGHTPIAYSRSLGEVAEELRGATVPVIDDLDHLAAAPHVIHGQHHLETMTAALRFPGVPAIALCHGWLPAEEAPPRFPTIRRYVAVDEPTRDRLVLECGIPPERVRLHPSFVDLDRFRRRPPLPARPRRALVFSNLATEEGYVAALRTACSAAGISLDVLGLAAGTACARPEEALGEYDVVFAKGRAALEAGAVGAAVVLCDRSGLGPMVTARDLERLRALNFGVRLLREPVTPELAARELARYDPEDAAAVTELLRAEAGLAPAVDRLLALYAEVIAEHRAAGPPDPEAQAQAAAAYLRHGPLRGGDLLQAERERLAGERAQLETARAHLETTCARLEDAAAREAAERRAVDQTLAAQRQEIARLQATIAHLEAELAWITGTAGWRLRQRLVGSPALTRVYRRLRGLPADDAADPGATAPPAPAAVLDPLAAGASLDERAERMAAAAGFLGVPVEDFGREGRLQLATLLRLGLSPTSKVLDLGCGCLRAGYWLIHFLEPGSYCGIEPRRDRVEAGLAQLLEPGLAACKRPRFDFNPDFDSSVFAERFDFYLARSIWTHASKPQIRRMLDAFLRDVAPAAVFLTSYLPAGSEGPDYQGASWVGTSHECDVPGVVRHSLAWIQAECDERGLTAQERPEDDFGGQRWLVLRRRSG
ncbi:MAG TPA: glycosyltransferase [Thermoanaerobaculia bacterium]|nr:glycosyltransferase [Thermoanaerobaculia bacterium]